MKSIKVLGMRVDITQIPEVIRIMDGWIEGKNYGNYIVISNANDAVMCRKNREILQAVNNSSLSVPDGISLVLAGRLKGFGELKRRVYGPDLMDNFLAVSQDKGYSHFFFGSTGDTLERLLSKLKMRYPRIKIAGYHSPPFKAPTEQEEENMIGIINRSSADILWVGLGCPKQQLWMHHNRDKIKVPVMVGVGAAFDFIAGTKMQAPGWIRNNGFEWLFRLITEPKRLWRRYLVNGSLFVYYFAGELLSDTFKGKRRLA